MQDPFQAVRCQSRWRRILARTLNVVKVMTELLAISTSLVTRMFKMPRQKSLLRIIEEDEKKNVTGRPKIGKNPYIPLRTLRRLFGRDVQGASGEAERDSRRRDADAAEVQEERELEQCQLIDEDDAASDVDGSNVPSRLHDGSSSGSEDSEGGE